MRRAFLAVVLGAVCMPGCRQDMHDQPKINPQAEARFFPDKRGGRPLVEGTLARSAPVTATPALTGKDDGGFVRQSPLPATAAIRGVACGRMVIPPAGDATAPALLT